MAGRLGRIGEPSSAGTQVAKAPSGRLGRIQTDQKILDAEAKRQRQEKAKVATDKLDADLKKTQDGVWSPKNIFGDIAKAASNVTAAVNEKVLGGAGRAIVKGYNTVTSGFNNDEANKKTDAFLKKTKQVNDKGESTLATGKGVDRNSEAFKVGQDEGNLIKSLTVDPLVGTYKALKTTVDQAKASKEIENKGGGINQDQANKLKKFVDQDEKAGKLTKEQANAKRNELQARADKTKLAISTVESNTGLKVNQSEGVTALLETAANLAGLEGAAKVIYKKAAEAATGRIGRDLTKDEMENLATRTKETVSSKTPEAIKSEPDINIQPTIETPANPTIREDKVAPIETIPSTPIDTPVAPASDSGRVGKLSTEPTVKPVEQPTISTVETPQVKTIESPEINPPKPEGDTVSGNSRRIESVALEKKLADKMGDLPEYKSINMKEQADEAVNLISADRQKAIDIIDGKVNPDGNLKAQSVHQALEDIAIKEGDGELLTKLAKSHVNTELSESAQNLRIAAERDPHSPVEAIRQIRDARVKAAERRNKTTVSKAAKEIKKKVEAATPKATKQDWNSFVKELTC